MQCELCEADLLEAGLALVEGVIEALPPEATGVVSLTGQICAACWQRLGRPLSCLLHRGRVLAVEDIFPVDMRPVNGADLARRAAADRVDVADEVARAEGLKSKLNRYAVLTFNDPYSGNSVVVDREEWEDPLEVAVAVVRAVQELRALGLPAVEAILDRAGFIFVPSVEPT